MDRVIVYPGEVPADTDVLSGQANARRAVGAALQMMLGTGEYCDGLAASPSGMSVVIGPGSIAWQTQADATAYGSLGTDTTNLVTMAINKASVTLGPFTAPSAGQSVAILIEGAPVITDGAAATLPYMNAANPTVPYGGPGNNGVAQPTKRTETVSLQAKVGTAATTGSQVTPSVDSGWIALYVVTIPGGASSITSGMIAVASGAPFVTNKLPVLAPLASPAFSGVPTAPTAGGGTNTTQLATTAFVASAVAPLAPLASPGLTGTPTAPTAAAGTATTQLATTAFVTSGLSAAAFGRLMGAPKVFSSSGTYTPTTGATLAIVEAVGGGGGSGSTSTTTSGQVAITGGAAGGTYGKGVLSLSGVSSVSVTVGAAGTGANSAGTGGGTGGTTSFGSYLSCPGGIGGAAGAAQTTSGLWAGPGSSSPAAATFGGGMVAVVNKQGDTGTPGFGNSGGCLGGSGGDSPFGTGGSASNTAANAGNGYGAGGGGTGNYGAASWQYGANGSPGYLVVWEFM